MQPACVAQNQWKARLTEANRALRVVVIVRQLAYALSCLQCLSPVLLALSMRAVTTHQRRQLIAVISGGQYQACEDNTSAGRSASEDRACLSAKSSRSKIATCSSACSLEKQAMLPCVPHTDADESTSVHNLCLSRDPCLQASACSEPLLDSVSLGGSNACGVGTSAGCVAPVLRRD